MLTVQIIGVLVQKIVSGIGMYYFHCEGHLTFVETFVKSNILFRFDSVIITL